MYLELRPNFPVDIGVFTDIENDEDFTDAEDVKYTDVNRKKQKKTTHKSNSHDSYPKKLILAEDDDFCDYDELPFASSLPSKKRHDRWMSAAQGAIDNVAGDSFRTQDTIFGASDFRFRKTVEKSDR